MRIVVKIGTSTLAHPTGHLNIRRVEELCKVLSDIKNAGHEVILVSSGAIGMGWAIIPLAAMLFDLLTPTGFWLLLGGGISYTLGAVLFSIPKKWLHSVFHVFVVLGSVLQFFAFYQFAI